MLGIFHGFTSSTSFVDAYNHPSHAATIASNLTGAAHRAKIPAFGNFFLCSKSHLAELDTSEGDYGVLLELYNATCAGVEACSWSRPTYPVCNNSFVECNTTTGAIVSMYVLAECVATTNRQ